jgi:16S rRNA (uracil1498-N3)-methyltransferase
MDRSVLRTTSAHVLIDAGSLADGATIALDDPTEHHLDKVLRLRDGERVGVTDGSGRWCVAVAVRDAGAVRLEAVSEVVDEPAPARPITLAVAIPKGDRLDWMVQKVTELGVDRLALLHADRSVVRWKPDRTGHHLARLQRIADEALRQSRRVRRLTIDAPVPAADALGGYVIAEPGGRRLVATDTSVAIGPEGGWSDGQLAIAGEHVDLGPTILRTETAAVAVSALCVTFNR